MASEAALGFLDTTSIAMFAPVPSEIQDLSLHLQTERL